MKVIYQEQLQETYRQAVWELTVKADKEFVPPLSARNSTRQDMLAGAPEGAAEEMLPGAYFREMENKSFLLAIEKDTVVGFLSFIPDYHSEYVKDSREILYVSTIIVEGGYRNQGISHRLYDELMADFPDCAVATRTWSLNDAHIHLLEKLGFDLVKRLPDDRGKGIDTVYYKR